MKRSVLISALCGSIGLAGLAGPFAAQAHAAQRGPSAISELSALPLMVSVAVPVALLTAGSMLTVAAVSSVAEGTVWVLERASDGAQASITVIGQVAGGLSVVAGTVLVATACSAGWVLSAAGRAVAFVPNEVGKALLHSERVTR
jgi:hypothetical protein